LFISEHNIHLNWLVGMQVDMHTCIDHNIFGLTQMLSFIKACTLWITNILQLATCQTNYLGKLFSNSKTATTGDFQRYYVLLSCHISMCHDPDILQCVITQTYYNVSLHIH